MRSLPNKCHSDSKLLITKDTLRQDELPPFGNRFWKTPNLDALAAQGTVFFRHYTTAPSTAMAITSIFTGLYAHELDRARYVEVEPFKGVTLFDKLRDAGLATHVVWSKQFVEYAWQYSKVFPPHTQVHNLEEINWFNPEAGRTTPPPDDHLVEKVTRIVKSILSNGEKVFVWLHLNNVILGRESYGADIDCFDAIVGAMRAHFSDNQIYVSADHGHMRMEKGIDGYGFHVYDGNIKVPLISPRIDGIEKIEFPTSHSQLGDILLHSKVEKRRFIYADTKYYMQPNRKLAIINGDYKYIYNKDDGSEELYDTEWDPHENANLMRERVINLERGSLFYFQRIYYYPHQSQLAKIKEILRAERRRIWRNGSGLYEVPDKARIGIKKAKVKLIGLMKRIPR